MMSIIQFHIENQGFVHYILNTESIDSNRIRKGWDGIGGNTAHDRAEPWGNSSELWAKFTSGSAQLAHDAVIYERTLYRSKLPRGDLAVV